jgi:hypothetical protein
MKEIEGIKYGRISGDGVDEDGDSGPIGRAFMENMLLLLMRGKESGSGLTRLGLRWS